MSSKEEAGWEGSGGHEERRTWRNDLGRRCQGLRPDGQPCDILLENRNNNLYCSVFHKKEQQRERVRKSWSCLADPLRLSANFLFLSIIIISPRRLHTHTHTHACIAATRATAPPGGSGSGSGSAGPRLPRPGSSCTVRPNYLDRFDLDSHPTPLHHMIHRICMLRRPPAPSPPPLPH
jgi:hypothetical protein